MINSKGGTELLHANLIERLGKEDLQGINLFINQLSEKVIQSGQINILWNHHSHNQTSVQGYLNKELLKKFNILYMYQIGNMKNIATIFKYPKIGHW